MPVALLLPALQLLQPMPGVVTQGVRPGHPAIDIACAPGTPVRAAHDGKARVERSYTHGITLVLMGPMVWSPATTTCRAPLRLPASTAAR